MPVRTARIAPRKNPPPIKRLMMAVGSMTKAARIRNLRNIITTAPKRTKPSTMPSMKLNVPSEATHGRSELQYRKKLGESRAIPLAMINKAARPTIVAGNHHNLASIGKRVYGPYQPAGCIPPTPAAFIGGMGATAAAGGDAIGVGAGTEW